MTFETFCSTIAAKGWTLEQLRCDVPPSEELLGFIEEAFGDAPNGPAHYESLLNRWIRRESKRQPAWPARSKR